MFHYKIEQNPSQLHINLLFGEVWIKSFNFPDKQTIQTTCYYFYNLLFYQQTYYRR